MIFHRAKSFVCEYDSWLDDCKENVYLVISKEMNRYEHCSVASVPNAEFYSGIIFLDRYDDTASFHSALDEVGSRGEITKLIAHYEFDLIRVAEARESRGIAGQSLLSACAFRDKLEMKRLVSAAGLIGYRFGSISDWSDVERFYSAVGGKRLILKPRSGSTSLGVICIDDPYRQREEIEKLLRNPLALSPDYMAEEFIEGEMYHVDGLILNGEQRLLWPSQYITGSLEFQDEFGQTVSSAMLGPDDKFCKSIITFVGSVIAALPVPTNCNIHCEVFVTPSGNIELCEIASRTGGVRIKHGLARAFRFDIAEAWIRAEASLPQRTEAIPSRPEIFTGWATMAGRDGKVACIPDSCEIEGVWAYQRNVSTGDVVQSPRSAVDYIANCDIEGPDHVAIVSRIHKARRWFASYFATI
ncbi:ATP-grasp domain-containing protein [Phytopseudomonas flavescens]|uniref:ATP-grasp domain-containing protein n=1 Tax=Phytopseudomonas flavescens TaxID=29435 RepID=UPI001FC94719|nr:ATP-grasp domain-containing protein [Pseudomonas flavescens]